MKLGQKHSPETIKKLRDLQSGRKLSDAVKKIRHRPVRVEGDAAYISLTKGFEAVIDASDMHKINGYNLRALISRRTDGSIRTVYAFRRTRDASGKQVMLYLHRVVLEPGEGLEVDHIDGDGLNNRRCNLRVATRLENSKNCRKPITNTSGVKGVHWYKRKSLWAAYIDADGKRQHLGYFASLDAAAAARAEATKALHGKFGRVV